MPLSPDSATLSPLPDVLSHGLVAVSTFGLLSFFCSTSLFLYLTWRIISWRKKSGTREPINQFLFLIYNLLLADMQQALAFLLNISALKNNAIEVGSPTCFAQGWFVSTGDLSSSIFIFAIGAHTFLGVVKEYRLPTKVFYSTVAGLWIFNYVLAAIGPIVHGHNFYVRASAWVCLTYSSPLTKLTSYSAGSILPTRMNGSGSTISGSSSSCLELSSFTLQSSSSYGDAHATSVTRTLTSTVLRRS